MFQSYVGPFSLTIVVLNLASSQFGPRLLRNFMEDRSTQFVLGTFVSSFICCLFVLRSIETFATDTFVPNLSVIFAVLLALFDVGVLIFFIHHIATSIQVDEVVADISRELEENDPITDTFIIGTQRTPNQDALPEKNDREDVRQRYQLLLHALNEFNDDNGPYEVSDGISFS